MNKGNPETISFINLKDFAAYYWQQGDDVQASLIDALGKELKELEMYDRNHDWDTQAFFAARKVNEDGKYLLDKLRLEEPSE